MSGLLDIFSAVPKSLPPAAAPQKSVALAAVSSGKASSSSSAAGQPQSNASKVASYLDEDFVMADDEDDDIEEDFIVEEEMPAQRASKRYTAEVLSFLPATPPRAVSTMPQRAPEVEAPRRTAHAGALPKAILKPIGQRAPVDSSSKSKGMDKAPQASSTSKSKGKDKAPQAAAVSEAKAEGHSEEPNAEQESQALSASGKPLLHGPKEKRRRGGKNRQVWSEWYGRRSAAFNHDLGKPCDCYWCNAEPE